MCPVVIKLTPSIGPLGARVVLLPVEKEQETAGGIIIPDTAKGEKPQQGTVVALGKGGIGKDCVNPSDFLVVGDKVLFSRYAGDDVKVKDGSGKDVTVRIVNMDVILGLVN
jgi:chaperonin GroES